jgi:H+-translocating NAD(P) transhydrogenase subunit alpha
LDEDFYQKQRELMARVVAESDVVITTAAIPGKPSPLLVTRAAVEGMAPGSVIVDLAAERGGNCEPSQPNQRVVHHGVVIHGPTNLVSEAPFHASQMYSNNITRFLLNMVKNGQLAMNLEDEIVRETCVAHGGQVAHPRIRELLGLPALPPAAEADGGPTEPADAARQVHDAVSRQLPAAKFESGTLRFEIRNLRFEI